MSNHKRYSIPLFLVCALFCGMLQAESGVVLPANKLTYRCHCLVSNKQGICSAFLRSGVSAPPSLVPHAKKLPGGWVIQLSNCRHGQQYELTAGSVIFSGQPIAAIFSRLQSPLAESGYVYHVKPVLPFTRQNYSLTVVQNERIQGIDLHRKPNGWSCGQGNRQVSCHTAYSSARCLIGKSCHFLYR